MTTPTVLILGAAGRLGQQLTRAFADAGWRTLAQSRKDLPPQLANSSRVESLRCDAFAQAHLLRVARDATVVINALNPPYDQWERLALPLAAAAQELAWHLGALLMLPGNVYGFGRQLPSVLHTHSPEVGDTRYGRVRIAIERQMAEAAAQGLDSVVLRAGDFFGGTQRGSWLDLVITRELHRGKMRYPGPMDATHAWAFLPDLAQCCVHLAARRAELRGHRRLHFAGHAIDGATLLAGLQAVFPHPVQADGMPWGLIRLGALLKPEWRAVLEMRYLWDRPHTLDGTELSQLIGPLPHTDLLVALRMSLLALGFDVRPTPAPPGEPVACSDAPDAGPQSSRAFFSARARS